MKPGYLTTEFWITLVAQAVNIAVQLGWVGAGEAGTLKDALTQVIAGVVAIVSLVEYVRSRTALKGGKS